MNIYLDIDGVILTKEGKPAKNLNLVLDYLTNNHKVYWLTTHCKGNAKDTVNYITRYFKPETIKYLNKISATNWRTNKTEAINFNKDFFWLDDYIIDSERKELIKNNSWSSYIDIDLKHNPDILKFFFMMLIERDKNLERINKNDVNGLVKEAMELIEEQRYDRVNVFTFQRRLRIGNLLASLVVDRLFKDKIIYDPVLSEDEVVDVVFKVDKDKIRTLMIN
jgi:hypothetical protein